MDIRSAAPRVAPTWSERAEHQLEQQGVSVDRDEATRHDVEQISAQAQVSELLEGEDLSGLMAQFGRKSRLEKDKPFPANYDRVLQEDVQHRVEAMLTIVADDTLSLQAMLAQARQLFPDDSDLVLVLREMLRRKTLDEILKKRVRQLLVQVEQQADPRRLKAGINCALKARLFGKTLQVSGLFLRESYREFLTSDDNGVASYESWIRFYGVAKRALVLEFIDQALIADMNAVDPSCHVLEFGPFLSRIHLLHVLKTADAQMLKLLACQPDSTTESDCLTFLLGALQYPEAIDEALLMLLGDTFRSQSLPEQSLFLQRLLRAMTPVPGMLYAEDNGRDTVLDHLKEFAGVLFDAEQRARRRARG